MNNDPDRRDDLDLALDAWATRVQRSEYDEAFVRATLDRLRRRERARRLLSLAVVLVAGVTALALPGISVLAQAWPQLQALPDSAWLGALPYVLAAALLVAGTLSLAGDTLGLDA
ncbi:hypothetical protein GCM10011521_09830 [Arenimonas soli]|uniref:Uncharacterized protein n=1 Tax=Arenimonas soli TaxID=2269504 RepID=A0ABQ1HFD3_9GAMM|nr:hypothetical protein [Arenimonas soli]GGA73735.1 hypothetical protein GCM10011521_09830 [Arenimonas soli]